MTTLQEQLKSGTSISTPSLVEIEHKPSKTDVMDAISVSFVQSNGIPFIVTRDVRSGKSTTYELSTQTKANAAAIMDVFRDGFNEVLNLLKEQGLIWEHTNGAKL